MKKLLVVVDMQNDFIDGVLGSEDAKKIVKPVCDKIDSIIQEIKSSGGESSEWFIASTYDTHFYHPAYYNVKLLQDIPYEMMEEEKRLPMHCEHGTKGWFQNKDVYEHLSNYMALTDHIPVPQDMKVFGYYKNFFKVSYGSVLLSDVIRDYQFDEIHLVGLCTDICVISNALMIRSSVPCARVVVDAACCAGVSKESHEAALTVMRCCGIEVINA